MAIYVPDGDLSLYDGAFGLALLERDADDTWHRAVPVTRVRCNIQVFVLLPHARGGHSSQYSARRTQAVREVPRAATLDSHELRAALIAGDWAPQ
jgi:hypothetical protein